MIGEGTREGGERAVGDRHLSSFVGYEGFAWRWFLEMAETVTIVCALPMILYDVHTVPEFQCSGYSFPAVFPSSID